VARSFDLNNSNISYFVGIDANRTNRQMILAGDRNLTNGMAPRNGLIELTTNRLTSWTSEMHKRVGNVALADGSVQMVSIPGVHDLVAKTGFTTNRLQMPILGP
jgi:prepilin-type processing-associated H-X9-DG protein